MHNDVSRLLTKPVFMLSLDAELAWGFILNPNHPVLNTLKNSPEQERRAVDLLLKLLAKYDIRATWAVTGYLFLNESDARDNISPDLPVFKEGWIKPDFYESIRTHPAYLGNDIVEKILASQVCHEIGLHGFFHIPFARCSREVARAEVEMGIKAASQFGINPKSFVFPRDEVGHLDVLIEHGIKIYRGKQPGKWREDQNLFVRKFNQAIWDRLNTQGILPTNANGIWEIPSSMFYCNPRFPFSLPLQARLGLNRTIQTKKIFHTWLHPHNLLLYRHPEKNLEPLLALIARQRDKGALTVMTMGELVDYLTVQAQLRNP